MLSNYESYLKNSFELIFFSMGLPKTQPSPYATCLAYNNTTSIINQKKPWAPNSNGRYSSRSANQIHASARKTPSFQQFHDSKADVNGLKQCYRRICNVCFPFYDIFFPISMPFCYFNSLCLIIFFFWTHLLILVYIHRHSKTSTKHSKRLKMFFWTYCVYLFCLHAISFHKDDVKSFKLLLKNQERFGKPKIPLVMEQKPQETIHSRTCNNSFPIKK